MSKREFNSKTADPEVLSVDKQFYHDDPEKPHIITPLDVEGRNHGVQEVYREGGRLWSEHPYQHGIKHGTEKFYAEDGKVFKQTTYVNGKENNQGSSLDLN